MHLARITARSGLLLLAGAFDASAAESIGQTFPIAEPDTLAEIQARGAGKDWKALMKSDPADNSAFKTAALPRAALDATRLFDPTYTMPRDLVGQDGKIIYRQGQQINVYERLKLPGRYVVIGPEQEYMDWLRDVVKPTASDRLFLVNGSLLEVRQRTKLPVMAVDERVIERFGLRAVPAVISQEGTKLRVREYALR